MFLLSKRLRWHPPSHPHELYDCANGHMFILYTYLTHVVRLTEESIYLATPIFKNLAKIPTNIVRLHPPCGVFWIANAYVKKLNELFFLHFI